MNSQKGISREVIIILVICLLAAILSFTLIASYTTSQGFMDPILQSLDEKKQDVLELTAASTGASIGITALPGDIATPIAEKMASISQYLLIVICAIYLEKYLVTVMGFVTFRNYKTRDYLFLIHGFPYFFGGIVINKAYRILDTVHVGDQRESGSIKGIVLRNVACDLYHRVCAVLEQHILPEESESKRSQSQRDKIRCDIRHELDNSF